MSQPAAWHISIRDHLLWTDSLQLAAPGLPSTCSAIMSIPRGPALVVWDPRAVVGGDVAHMSSTSASEARSPMPYFRYVRGAVTSLPGGTCLASEWPRTGYALFEIRRHKAHRFRLLRSPQLIRGRAHNRRRGGAKQMYCSTDTSIPKYATARCTPYHVVNSRGGRDSGANPERVWDETATQCQETGDENRS